LTGGMFLAMVTVHCTIMISIVMPRPNDARQTRGSGHSIASDSGAIAIAAPMMTTNSIGRRGVKRSDTIPPAMSPMASAAVIAPQAAGPPRCALATTGPDAQQHRHGDERADTAHGQRPAWPERRDAQAGHDRPAHLCRVRRQAA